ncbi:MAG: hypothetical protein KDB14_06315 [Planctomycetales bacterium]|nr:hypothetical protein [Planctomycetales bacterium]
MSERGARQQFSQCLKVMLPLILAFISSAGCGPPVEKGVIVKGKLLHDGKPLTVPGAAVNAGWVEIELNPLGEGAVEYGMLNPDGEFLFSGQGTGIKPGRYRMAVYQRSQGPETDDLNGAFSRENTKLEIEVDPKHLGETQDLGTIEMNGAR